MLQTENDNYSIEKKIISYWSGPMEESENSLLLHAFNFKCILTITNHLNDVKRILNEYLTL